jgi:hypothetical protein
MSFAVRAFTTPLLTTYATWHFVDMSDGVRLNGWALNHPKPTCEAVVFACLGVLIFLVGCATYTFHRSVPLQFFL